MIRGGLDPALMDHYLSEWWFVGKSSNVRLSRAGYDFLTQKIKFPSYDFVVQIEKTWTISSRLLLLLDKKMDAPYYIHLRHAIQGTITHFSERDAMMLALIDNDITRYLSSMK